MKKYSWLMLLLAYSIATQAQELNAKVTVLSNQVGPQTDKRVFNTLQTALTNFLNNRKWTPDNFKTNERIECAFLLNLRPVSDQNVYNAELTIQAARPIYNSSYNSPTVNYRDQDVVFKYTENQPIEFNENRVNGTDPLVSNLTAILAFYVDAMLAMDYASFSQGGGEPYYKKMLNIVNNAPEGREIKGWTQFDGLRNRYWLAENLTNPRYQLLNEIFYGYYHTALDNWYDNDQQARQQMLNVLNQLNQFVTENRNTMIVQFFMVGKSSELIKMFQKAAPDEKARVVEMLAKIDVTNANTYREQLK